jgi:serine/threonine protein phosphatase PrpC
LQIENRKSEIGNLMRLSTDDTRVVNISIGFKTDVGRKRETNQDSYAVLRGSDLNGKLDALFVVADGMGGVGGGEVASSIVAQTVPQAVYEFLADRNGGTTPIDVPRLLRETIVRANNRVRSTRKFEKPELGSMGTTCIAAIVHQGQITFANVGDSRAYLLRAGKLSQITKDHSRVYEEFLAGKMTRDEADKSRFRNVITRAIGLGPTVKADIEAISLEEGDTVLLCTDGLNTEIADAEIARVLAYAPGAQEACDWLIKEALENGGRDNITVVAMRYGDFAPLPWTEPGPRPWEEEEEEDDTDPLADWRKQPERFDEDREGDWSAPQDNRGPRYREDASRDRRQKRPKLGAPAAALIAILLLAALGEGVGLYLLWRQHKSPAVVTSGTTPKGPSTKKPDASRMYDRLTLLYSRPLQATYLQLSPDGTALVVSKQGMMLRITPQGQAIPLASPFPMLPADTTGTATRTPEREAPSSGRADVALDSDGNLYQIEPHIESKLNCINIYNSAGTRINAKVGKGSLIAPTKIAVDSRGTIYVIDNHQLKQIEADVPPKEPKASSAAPVPQPPRVTE